MADSWLETPYSLETKKVWVAGHRGLVGSAMVRLLKERVNCRILEVSRGELDLKHKWATREWMRQNEPDIVVLAAAKVGGIVANNSAPDKFLRENLLIQNNVIHAAGELGVEKLLFLGSSCIYPKDAAQPISEDSLLQGKLESTNKAYAIAKIAGIKLCEIYRAEGHDFITAMPCNLYGPYDRFDLHYSHVLPALMMKAHAVKEEGGKVLRVMGSGEPFREFLHVDDLAEALLLLLEQYSGTKPVNIGSGEEASIRDVAKMICKIVGFDGDLQFDISQPDGVWRKLLDSSRIKEAGWLPKISLEEGLKTTYGWYREHYGYDKAA